MLKTIDFIGDLKIDLRFNRHTPSHSVRSRRKALIFAGFHAFPMVWLCKQISFAAILMAISALTQPLFATVIYQDTFTGPAATMNGRTPDTVSSGNAWSSPVTTQFAVDGSGNGSLSAAVPSATANGAAGPTLPFTPDGSSVYALSVDVTGFGDVNANHWFTLGFTATNNGVSWFTGVNGGRAEMLVTPAPQMFYRAFYP